MKSTNLPHHNMRDHNNHEQRFGRSLVARLSAASDDLPNDISERLKAARMLALEKRKVTKVQLAFAISNHGGAASLHLGGSDRNWWNVFASLLPLVALVAGLMLIEVLQDELRTSEVAEVDAELLTDELPPAAYADPGFIHFLNINRQN